MPKCRSSRRQGAVRAGRLARRKTLLAGFSSVRHDSARLIGRRSRNENHERQVALGRRCFSGGDLRRSAHQPPSRTAGTTTGKGNTEAPFEVRIELPASVHPASIDVDQPFRVVITNTSDKDVSISSSNPRDEYGQLAVQFRNLRTGTTAIARRREIYAPQYWPRRIEATDADVRRIRIGSRGTFVMDVRLGDFVLDTPVWIGVPDPNFRSLRPAGRACFASRVFDRGRIE